MAAWHLYATMQEAAANEVQRLLPHSYVAGPDDAKVERGLIRWDSRVQAGGQEALLEELQSCSAGSGRSRRDAVMNC